MEIKAKYFLLEPKCGAWRQNGGRLGDATKAGRPVLRGLEVILQILRFGDHFCRDHGASAPPPSFGICFKFYRVNLMTLQLFLLVWLCRMLGFTLLKSRAVGFNHVTFWFLQFNSNNKFWSIIQQSLNLPSIDFTFSSKTQMLFKSK